MKSGKSLALFDIDKTIYSEHSFFKVTKYFVDEGIVPKTIWKEVNIEAKKYFGKKQSYSETANNLLEIYGGGLVGLNYERILGKTKEFFINTSGKFYPYFEKILPDLKKKYEVYLISTNSQMIAEAVVNIYKLDGYLSTMFEIKNGEFTGKVLSTLADGKHVVECLVSKYQGNTIAVGDSDNDISMLEKVKTPICINPSEELLLVAKKRKWLVVNENDISSELRKLLN